MTGHRVAEAVPVDARRVLFVATLATIAGSLPVFLVGSMAGFIREDFALGSAQLGAVIASFFAASALATSVGGRVADRLGPKRALGLAGVASATSYLSIGLLARSGLTLVGCLVFGAVGNGVAQPSSNLLLARGIPVARQGLSFSLKQAAVPISTLLAGVAVPVAGSAIGWRATFVAGVGLTWAFLLLPRDSAHAAGAARSARPKLTVRRRALVLLAAGGLLGSAAANSMGTFYVESAVDRGIEPNVAGGLLVVGSVCGIVGRLITGHLADQRVGGHVHRVAALLTGGAIGFVVLGSASTTTGLVLGTAVAFGAGWGWTGLLHFAVVRANRAAPATATGIAQTGLYLGGSIGPLAFGAVVQSTGFDVAWSVAAGAMVGGALLMVAGNHAARRVSVSGDQPSAVTP